MEAGLEELRADKEAAEDEEEIDTDPADGGERGKGGGEKALHVEVEEHDDEDGGSAEGVESVETERWCRWGGGHRSGTVRCGMVQRLYCVMRH